MFASERKGMVCSKKRGPDDEADSILMVKHASFGVRENYVCCGTEEDMCPYSQGGDCIVLHIFVKGRSNVSI
jgi:hypothetical protein